MINVTSTAQYQTLYANTKSAAAKDTESDLSFSEYLSNAAEETAQTDIPDKWRTDQQKNAIDIVVAYLDDNFGIDANKRTPTHEITEEQKEWLSSRHDLSKLHEYSYASAEMQNFLADLVYLNVISPDEAKSFGLTVYPGHTSVLRKVESTGSTTDTPHYTNLAEALAGALAAQQDLISYIQSNPSGNQAKDFDYLESALKNAEQQREMYEILLELYE